MQPTSTQTKYDVFNTSSFAMVNTYRIHANLYGESCRLNLVLQLDDLSTSLKSANQETLEFEWSGQSGISVANQWHVSLTSDKPTATVQMRFPSKQWLTAGGYEGVLEMSSLSAATGDLVEVSPLSLRVHVSVPPAAKIHYYGSSQSHYDLALGELYSNKTINASPKLWVQSNSAYTVKLTSQHNGALRHESDNPKWDIPYRLTLDNDTVDLKQVEAYIRRHKATIGMPISMNFLIGETSQKPGGQYEDTLEISIEPNLSQPAYF